MTSGVREDDRRLVFEDHFDKPILDAAVWLPHYLPAWSSRAATAATYDIEDSCLRLSIPPEQDHWLPGEHTPPLRVSGIQSGNFSGRVGSTIGQQPWREGDAVEPGVSTTVGMGLHPFRDPGVVEDFEAVRLPIDVSDFHTYAVDWSAERADFLVDAEHVRSCRRPPTYPMQMMIAVFDLPDRSAGDDDDAVPELIVDYLHGYER
jgi:hypothetical protein